MSSARGYKKPVVDCPALDDEVLRLIERNDPEVVGLTIEGGEFWVEGAGRIIGENECLTVLHIVLQDAEWEEDSWLGDVCRGLAHNRSIEWLKLDVNKCPVGLDIFHILGPFLENNHGLRCITLEDFRNPDQLSSVASALKKCKQLQLECIEVACHRATGDEAVASFFESLSNLHNLMDLVFDLYIGRMGCTALANLLRNPASNIINLHPTFNNIIDNESITIISDAIIENSSLISLEVTGNGLVHMDERCISSYGWASFLVLCLSR